MATKKKVKESPVEIKAREKDLLKFGKNWADNDDVAGRFMKEFSELINRTRQNRRSLEEKWLSDQRLWSCQLDGEGYQGMSNVFVPELHHQVEAGVEKAVTSLFPSFDYIYAIALNGTSRDKAEKIRNAILYELEHKNQLSVKHDEYSRQKILFGTSIYKTIFVKEMVDIFTREKPAGDDKVGKAVKTSVPRFHGTQTKVVDLFRWYIYPETSPSIEDALMTFEDQWMNINAAKRATDNDGKPLYKNLDHIQEVPEDTKHSWVDSERKDLVSLYQISKEMPGCALFTEVWCDFAIDKDEAPVPCQIVVANDNTIVRLVRNPLWFQQSPYVGSRYIPRPGKLFYGFSLSDRIRTQNYMMNDVTNNTMDSLNYSLNPPTVIDPSLAGDLTTFKNRPGAKWMGSPEGVKVINFPDVSGTGLRVMQELRGQVAQFSDNAPNVAPQLEGKARSATQAQMVQSSITAKQRVQSRAEETEVLSKLCWRTHILLQQFMTDDWQIKYQGPEAGSWISDIVKPSDLVGEADFEWRGSSEEERNAVRSQQLLAFYNMALQTAAIMPGEVDLPALFRRIAKEAFALRDMDEIFKSMRDARTVAPELENKALRDGEDLRVNPGDNDKQHKLSHEEELKDPELSDEAKLALIRHIERHDVQEAGKKAMLEMKGKLEALQSLAQQAPQKGAGPQQGDGRSGPQVPSPMEGNRGQVASSPGDVMSSVKGMEA